MAATKVRDLLRLIKDAGGIHLRTRGSHQTWKVGNHIIVLVVNRLNDEAYKECIVSAKKAGINVRL